MEELFYLPQCPIIILTSKLAYRFLRDGFSFSNDLEHQAVALALLSWRSGLSKAQILADYPLEKKLKQQLQADLDLLNTHYPFQYLKGETDFLGLKLKLTSDVLIPRPETEEVVEWILSQITNQELRILDIGTGSGCIALALKKALPKSEVWASDISAKALKLAQANAVQNGLEIIFKEIDVFGKTIENLTPFDIIVSNPPYIPKSEKKLLAPNLAFEPDLALFTPTDKPLLFYNRIIELAHLILKQQGQIYFETHENYANILKANNYNNYQIELKQDLNAKDRMIRISTPFSK